MLLFFAILMIATMAKAQTPPPVSVKGQGSSTKLLPKWNLQVPNNQATNLGGIDALIETGNSNILVNPSFEHATADTGWTLSAGTFINDNSPVHGQRNAQITLSAQSLDFYQDSTLYASQFADGVQGLASVRVRTTLSGVRVCSRQNGVVTHNLCVNVANNGKWGLYKVPFILGGTSNGISINSNAVSLTGDIEIDDAFVGAVDLTQNMNACNSAACETVFSAKISSSGSTSGENFDWISSSSGSNTYTVNFTANTFTLTPNCTAISDQNNALIHVVISSISPDSIVVIGRRTDTGAAIASGFHLSCQKQGADFTAAKQLSNGNTYSSTNADTDWASCGHVPSDFTGFGTVTNIETQCKREGGDLLMKGKFTSGTPTAVEARLNLKLGGTALTSASSSVIPTIQLLGTGRSNLTSTTYFVDTYLIEPSVAYITFGQSTSTLNGVSKLNGSAFTTNGTVVSIPPIRIPISGWTNSNVIIGQFNGLESCKDSYECTDTFSAKVSAAGVVNGENLDFLEGNCTVASTSNYSCSFKSGVFTVSPVCTLTVEQDASTALSRNVNIKTISPSSITYLTDFMNGSINTLGAYPVHIICQKQGADYIGKTAKAVASDQNTRSIGATGVDIQSVYFAGAAIGTACASSPCTINRQVGTKITSVTRNGSGDYRLNGLDGTKYQCTGSAYNNAGAARVAMLFDSASSTSSYVNVSSQGVDTSYNSIICIGIP